jgi:hypothetical protein
LSANNKLKLLADELFEQYEQFHHTVANAAKSARWDGLTFDIKGETITSVEQIALAADLILFSPLLAAFFILC